MGGHFFCKKIVVIVSFSVSTTMMLKKGHHMQKPVGQSKSAENVALMCLLCTITFVNRINGTYRHFGPLSKMRVYTKEKLTIIPENTVLF